LTVKDEQLAPAEREAYALRYERELLEPRSHRLDELRDSYTNFPRTVFVIGCGPSLTKQDPALLSNRVCITTNSAHLWLGREPGPIGAAVCTDTARFLELCRGGLLRMSRSRVFAQPSASGFRTKRSAEAWFRNMHANRDWIPLPGCGPHRWPVKAKTPTFRPDIGLESCGKSVIFSGIQMAVYMGAARVVLLGVDMDYSGPQQHFRDGISVRKAAKDVYEQHSRDAFVEFRRVMDARGVPLLNATEGGRVDVLERVRLEDVV
jgi:hypothetical protein